MITMKDIKELDKVKIKDGRIGTVMGIYDGTNGMEVEFSNTSPETETIDVEEIIEVIKS